jgi:hypothetical protein
LFNSTALSSFDLVQLFLRFKIIDEDQNRNSIVKALETTEVMLTINAICSLSEANMAKGTNHLIKALGWVTNEV